jgi:hypothetical protein
MEGIEMDRQEILNTLIEYREELILRHKAKIEMLDEIFELERQNPQPLGIPYRKYMRGWHESQWQ